MQMARCSTPPSALPSLLIFCLSSPPSLTTEESWLEKYKIKMTGGMREEKGRRWGQREWHKYVLFCSFCGRLINYLNTWLCLLFVCMCWVNRDGLTDVFELFPTLYHHSLMNVAKWRETTSMRSRLLFKNAVNTCYVWKQFVFTLVSSSLFCRFWRSLATLQSLNEKHITLHITYYMFFSVVFNDHFDN